MRNFGILFVYNILLDYNFSPKDTGQQRAGKL